MADGPYNLPQDDDGTGGSSYGPYPQPGAGQAGAAMATRAALAGQAGIGARPQPDAPGTSVGEAPQFAQQPMGELDNLQRQGWSTKVYHGILDSLAGKFDTQYIPTENGVIKQDVAQGPGQQWKKIISGALAGFAGAQAAGTQGPGGAMRGAGAGVAAGMNLPQQQQDQREKEANTQFTQEQQAMTSKAQRSMLNVDLATKTFQLGQMNVEASVGDSQRYNQYMQTVHDAEKVGGYVIGHFKTPEEAYAAFEQDSTHHESLAHGRIVTMPQVTDGKINGIQAAYVPDDYMNSMTSDDIPVTYKFWDNGKPKEVRHVIPAGSVTNAASMDIQAKLSTMQMEDHWKEYEATFKQKELNLRQQGVNIEQSRENREAKLEPLQEEKLQAETTALKNKDPYNDPRLPWGTFNPDWAPVSHYPRGTPGIDITAVRKGLDANDQKVQLLSNNIVSNADEVGKILKDKYPDLSGPIDGRASRFKQWLGTNDPDIAKVQAFVHNLAMATVGIHGSRSKGNVDETQDVILRDFVNGPDAVKGAIDANVHSAQDFNNQIENKRIYGTYKGPDRSKQIKFDSNGAPLTEQQAGTISGQQQGTAQPFNVTVTLPNGTTKTYPFDTQDAANQFKKAAGIP